MSDTFFFFSRRFGLHFFFFSFFLGTVLNPTSVYQMSNVYWSIDVPSKDWMFDFLLRLNNKLYYHFLFLEELNSLLEKYVNSF